MIDLSFMAGTTVGVLGLGRSGLAVARALVAGGATVHAWDDTKARRDQAMAAHIPLTDLHSHAWATGDVLVLSPGIPHTHPAPHPVAALARAAGCAIIGDVELLARAAREIPKIGITGTNGKSTTTALIGHIFAQAGVAAQVGGNLGPPVSEFDDLGAHGVCVLEMSSYQLELAETLAFDVVVHLNIAPDHLDRHGGIDGYVAAKRRIFASLGDHPQTIIIGVDDRHSQTTYDDLIASGRQTVVPISVTRIATGGLYVVDGQLIDNRTGSATPVMDLSNVATLRGTHNHQNAVAAYAAVTSATWAGIEISPDVATRAIASFPGLAHRQEYVTQLDGVSFINDSKATNPDAAKRALGSYDNIYWIAGGRSKDGGLDDLIPALSAVRHAFLIGEAQDLFVNALDEQVATTRCDDLIIAVQAAFEMARTSGTRGTVLLAPACASFDQFANFEARGDAFRDAVHHLEMEGAQ